MVLILTSNLSTKIKLVSNPKIKRIGTGPLSAAIGVGLLFVGLWLIVALGVLPYNIYWSAILASAASAFGFLLVYMAYTIVRDGKRKYFLELNESEAVLTIYDELHNTKAIQMVLLDDITFAEYYPYRDSCTIILHSSYTRMEIPLWPFGSHSQDVLDFLDGSGVQIVDVQSDAPIPDEC